MVRDGLEWLPEEVLHLVKEVPIAVGGGGHAYPPPSSGPVAGVVRGMIRHGREAVRGPVPARGPA